jgi:toxin ParE1/3/4
VKVSYRQAALDDITRQFRFYLVASDAPEVAMRFREAVRRTIESLARNPLVGPRFFSESSRLNNLRSWPVIGFEAIRIYYLAGADDLQIVRILHGKRDIKSVIENESDKL